MSEVALPPEMTPPSPRSPGKPKVFDCPGCGGTVTLNAVGHSIRAICGHCGATIDADNENFRVVQQAHERLPVPAIPIGSFGKLDGKRWQVIGFVKKRDNASGFRWDEYLLFNPYYGFRFLVQAEGHWTLMELVKETVTDVGTTQSFEREGRDYNLFHRGQAIVDAVAGEFYWRVAKGDSAKVADFVAPPWQLSIEQASDEISVAVGKYVDAKELGAAFGLKGRLPKAVGVAPNQPSVYKDRLIRVRGFAFLIFVIATLVQVGFVALARNQIVDAERFLATPDNKDKTLSSQTFPLDGRLANVQIETSTNLENHWLELGLSLVNTESNQSYDGRQLVEYYSGYDSDGSWSEGSRSTSTLIPSIPRGQYQLLIDADSDLLSSGQPVYFNVEIRRDVPSWINYVFVVALIGFYPLYLLLKHYSFEKRRWSESDYSPQIYRITNDDD